MVTGFVEGFIFRFRV